MLKSYYLEIQAARITYKNYEELEEIDCDGALKETTKAENIGQWFVISDNGSEVWPRDIKLIPIRK